MTCPEGVEKTRAWVNAIKDAIDAVKSEVRHQTSQKQKVLNRSVTARFNFFWNFVRSNRKTDCEKRGNELYRRTDDNLYVSDH